MIKNSEYGVVMATSATVYLEIYMVHAQVLCTDGSHASRLTASHDATEHMHGGHIVFS